MSRKAIVLLLVLGTSLLSACESFDKSMASDAVDIPDEKPMPPVLTAPSPSSQTQ